jgi:TPR repeat protein
VKKLLILLLLSLGFIGLSNANLQYAIDEYNKENYEIAFKEIELYAIQGNGLAQWYLYWMYSAGQGTDKNENLAEAWKEKGLVGLEFLAMQGDPEAQYWHGENLGDDYSEGSWFIKSFNGFLLAANQGDPYAQGWLAEYYLWEIGVEKDEELGMSWLLKSAQGGDAYYQDMLGDYLKSEGLYSDLTRDDEEAIKWITKAAEQGHLGAISDLEAIGINVEVTADDNKIEASYNDSEKLLSSKITIEESSGLSLNRIGKWFIGSDCNDITSEIIVLHDQVMQRPFSTGQTLDIMMETNNEYSSQYFALSDYGDLFFFRDNIIFHSSNLKDYYFESVKFPELSSYNAYQTTQLLSCKNLNNDLGYILLESDAIEFDKFIYAAKNKCQDNKPIDCLKQFVDFADASNNNELSRAELTRFSRFVVKWLTLKGELQLNERMGAAAASMMIAPALAEFILLNYDYDNDDHIDIREMTYDIVNITGSSELNNKIIRGYIEAIDILSKSKKDATRMLEDLF